MGRFWKPLLYGFCLFWALCDLFPFTFLRITVNLDTDLPGKEDIYKGGVSLWAVR